MTRPPLVTPRMSDERVAQFAAMYAQQARAGFGECMANIRVDDVAAAFAEIVAARAECAGLREDAERWRFVEHYLDVEYDPATGVSTLICAGPTDSGVFSSPTTFVDATRRAATPADAASGTTGKGTE